MPCNIPGGQDSKAGVSSSSPLPGHYQLGAQAWNGLLRFQVPTQNNTIHSFSFQSHSCTYTHKQQLPSQRLHIQPRCKCGDQDKPPNP